MPCAYLADILSQPDALAAVLDDPPVAGPTLAAADIADVDRIVLTGMGASHYATYPAWLRLVQCGFRAWWVETSELLHYGLPLITPDTVLWCTSQSGRSAETLALLDHIRPHRPKLVWASTNDPGSPLASAADAVLDLRAGAESGVSTRSYLNTVAVSQLVVEALLGRDGRAELADTSAALAGYLASHADHLDLLDRLVGRPQRLVVLGRGPSLSAALTGALVLKEAAKVHAEGQSAGQFRHGPVELADPGLTVVVIEGPPETAGLNRRLAADLVGYGARVCWLGSADGSAWSVLPAPQGTGLARPITEVVPFQLLSVRLAEASGLEPGQFRNGAKVTVTE